MSDLVEKLRFYAEHPDLSALLDGSPSACDDILQPILIAAFKALTEAEKREREARANALEEAALWHDARVQEYTEQIAVNDAYLARSGRLSSESRANEYCDDMRSCHRRAAYSIRALQSEER